MDYLGNDRTPSLRQRLPSLRAISGDLGISHHAVSRAASTLVERGVLVRQGYRFFLARSPKEPSGSGSIHVVSLVPGIEEWLRDPPQSGRNDYRTHVLPDPSRGLGLCVDILEGRHGPCSGLIVWPTSVVPDALIARFLDRGIPVVACSAPSVCTSVQVDRLRTGTIVLEHLYHLGHRNVVVMALPGRNRRRKEQIAAFEYVCRHPLKPELEAVLAVSPGEQLSEISETLDALLETHPQATALVVPTSRCFEPALEVLSRKGLNIPGQFTLALLDADILTPPEMRVVRMANSDRQLLHIAVTLLREAMDSLKKFGAMPQRREVYVAPEVQSHGSPPKPPEDRVSPSMSQSASGQEFVHAASLAGRMWDRPAAERIAEARRQGREPHHQAKNRSFSNFHNIDLTPYFNRCFRHTRGWMGNLNLQLPAGVLHAHGVPFQIAGDDHTTEPCALLFASNHARQGASESLPNLVEIPIRQCVHAVYFLQGCGHCSEPRPFAEYKMIGQGGTLGEVALVPEVAESAAKESSGDGGQPSNIVDWFPGGEFWRNLRDPRAKTFVVTENGDPLRYERYLTTIEWVPPQPGTYLEAIRVSSLANRAETLGLLAITVK